MKRQAPFVYTVAGQTIVTFQHAGGRTNWAFVYDAGMRADAKARVR